MAGRNITHADSALLASFSCAHPDRWWELEVEEAIHEAAVWITERTCRWVRVFSAEGEIAVVVGYELVSPVDPEEGVYLPFVGVSSALQGMGLAEEALDDLAPFFRDLSFGGPIICRAHIRNTHSQSLLARKGFTMIEGASDSSPYGLWRAH